MTYDVLICGYGPAGEVAANLLGQRGIRTLVIDKSTDVYQVPRAVHFDGEVMRIFQSLGVEDEVQSVSDIPDSLTFTNGKGGILIHAKTRDIPGRQGWPSGNFFNQPMLEEMLRKAAERHPTVEVRLGWALESFTQDGESVTATIRRAADGEREEVSARFLLGCDGAGSATRECAGLELEDLRCEEPWLVCDVIADEGFPYRRDIYQFCDPRRPVTLVPCEGRHLRWEFMLMPGDDPEELESEESVHRLMAPYIGRLNPDLRPENTRLLRHKVYTFHGLVAVQWRAGRVFILGDAAHQTPPFLGQGLCAGVRDAYNLIWKLEGVLTGRFRDAVLDTYGTERRPHARAVVKQALRIGKVIQTRNPLMAFLRDRYFALARFLPMLLAPFLWEPSWPLGLGLFASGDPPSRESAHGNPFDQPVVETPDGRRARLDEVIGTGFVVLGLDLDPADGLDRETRATFDRLDTTFLCVRPKGGRASSDDEVVDADGFTAAWFARHGGGRILVIRPDRQVFGKFDSAAELAGAATTLRERLLGPT